MPDLALPGLSYHYEVSGDGAPLLLLAGMMSDSASWTPLLSLLEPHFTLIRPDNRTTGRTTPWDAPVSVGQMAEDAVALMDHLGYGRFHVVGHSMGGLMGMEVAGLAGSRVITLSILASGPVRVPRTMAVFDTLAEIRALDGGETAWLKALYPWIFRPAFFGDPANTEAALAGALAYPFAQSLPAMRHQIEALRGFRPRFRPADITAQTQVLFAEHDLLIPEAASRIAFAQMPNVLHEVIADAGHSIHWDQPRTIAHRIIAHARAG
ncbi:MAG: alpha/beta fold hydrolase [Rhodobacteraceae bacterium]|nr:MAG: alpha/beta fold hydrolase [Paracoccaceae bacterium]